MSTITDFAKSSPGLLLGVAASASAVAGLTISSNGIAADGWVLVATGSNSAIWRDAISFGSNTNDVSSVGTMGASASNSRADHVHRGVGALTSSTSNTLYGTVNLRPGANTSLTLDTTTNTVTIAGTGGGGGAGGAPTDAQYIVGTADATLTAEKVRSDLWANYHPDNYPTSGLTLSDEFDDDSLDGAWSWDTAPSATVSESTYSGFLFLDGGTDASATARHLTRSFTPGAAAFTVVGKVSMALQNGNWVGAIGIVVRTSVPATLWQMALVSDAGSTSSDAHRIIGTSGNMTGGDQLADGFYYVMIQRDSSTNYKGYFSRDGMTWQYIGGSSVAGTVAQVGIILQTDTDSTEAQHVVDFVRVFDSQTKVIGA